MTEQPPFSIFRMKDAPSLDDTGAMTFPDLPPAVVAGITEFMAAGAAEGSQTRTLFSVPGFCLVYAWFKSGYALPLHTHNADCLYYVIAGELRLGTETLGAGDGLFVPAGTPYTFTPGEQGVEVLEFRHETEFDMRFRGQTSAFWSKLAQRTEAARQDWSGQVPPSAGQ